MPVTARDRYAFEFGCSAGHTVSLSDLFERQTMDLRHCFEGLIATWEKSIREMAEGAEVARRHGSQDLAQRLDRRVTVLQARVLLFRETFLKADDAAAF